MSVFVGTTAAQFDAARFEAMIAIARNALQEKRTGNAQAIVLHTDKGADYCFVIRDALSADRTDENELLNQLIAKDDTHVQSVLCMWQNGDVDLPSYRFRKMLLEANADTANAEIFVFTENGYAAVKLERTMK